MHLTLGNHDITVVNTAYTTDPNSLTEQNKVSKAESITNLNIPGVQTNNATQDSYFKRISENVSYSFLFPPLQISHEDTLSGVSFDAITKVINANCDITNTPEIQFHMISNKIDSVSADQRGSKEFQKTYLSNQERNCGNTSVNADQMNLQTVYLQTRINDRIQQDESDTPSTFKQIVKNLNSSRISDNCNKNVNIEKPDPLPSLTMLPHCSDLPPHVNLSNEHQSLEIKSDKQLQEQVLVDSRNFISELQCHECGKSFANKHNLKVHMYTHTGEKRPKSFCPTCKKGFVKPCDLRRHMMVHSGIKPFDCKECGMTFANPSTLRQHARTHCDKKPHDCMQCGKQFTSNYSLQRHLISHSNTPLYRCDRCDVSLNSKYDLKIHTMKHNGALPYPCTLCAKSFGKPSDLNRHFVVHTGERPFQCNICDSTFTNSSNLRMHLITHSKIKPHPCNMCDKSFRRPSDLERHRLTHTGERPFICSICNMAFTTNYNLKIHLLKHSGALPYPCSLCDKSFSKPSELQRHSLVHSGERPYRCDQCQMRFTNTSNLKSHGLTHSGKRPYACEVCKKTFSRPSDVKRHLLTHLASRPFACSICGLAFTDQSNLKKHALAHAKKNSDFVKVLLDEKGYEIEMQYPLQNPYRCDSCSVTHLTAEDLETHLLSHFCDGNGTEQSSVLMFTKHEDVASNNIKILYTCAACGAEFNHAVALEEHVVRHNSTAGNSRCDICNKTFIQESYLKAHMATHTEERPHSCKVCGKCFKSFSHLKNHLSIHSGVKPYTCSTCSKTFLKHSSLKRHYATHERVNPVVCTVCNKTFLNYEYLRKHSLTHTNIS